MGYIGVTPEAGFTTGLLDRFTSTTGTTVTLTHEISSENDIIVFVNFVKQDSTNYSVGGSGNKTLTLGGTLVSSDVVEVHYLNIVNQTSAPSADSVGSSQITADVITGQTALASEPADTDEFLVSDAGTLKRIDYSLIKGSGKIGQVVNATKTDTFSSSSGSYVDVTGVSASITPSATTSKIFVILTLYVSNDTQTSNTFAKLVRGSTSLQESIVRIPQENQGVYRTYNLSMTDFDSPTSNSELTYKLQMLTNSGTFYVNRSANQGGFSGTHTVTLTLMEILA